ncbi:hypothetical protein PR202_gb08718 [Eleusine coracana subsp. coracana]|uniref:mRNA capping enzyme adenylation domain-containing protein n=1 Tax=Eleusine coracana subsp. coracana TaxID=191504 RepID=A0AAV5EGG5_ELECO|nr:hypothetical protein PR202_gb08718 [Eleusine coracana subsp. coracana]
MPSHQGGEVDAHRKKRKYRQLYTNFGTCFGDAITASPSIPFSIVGVSSSMCVLTSQLQSVAFKKINSNLSNKMSEKSRARDVVVAGLRPRPCNRARESTGAAVCLVEALGGSPKAKGDWRMHERVAFSADLNASPLPETEDEQLYEKSGKVQCAQEEHVESAVEIMRRIPCKGRDAVPDNESVNTFVHEAIHIFAERRPPGIYKRDYIEALYSFYHEAREITCPSTPEWKKPDDLDLNGEVTQDDDDNIDVAPPHGRGNSLFPGSHPVSLNCDNLQLLRQRYATWKADGTRYMMLIQRDGCYLIDRNFCFRRVQMRFPCRKPSKAPFSERWEILQKEIIEPRDYEKQLFLSGVKSNSSYKYEKELFSIRRKGFFVLSTAKDTLEKFIPKLCHDADGLIFQGWDDPYIPRTHEGLLKWKYPEMNSVDFLFEVMRSITDNITQEKLIHEVNEIMRLPMYADRIA